MDKEILIQQQKRLNYPNFGERLLITQIEVLNEISETLKKIATNQSIKEGRSG